MTLFLGKQEEFGEKCVLHIGEVGEVECQSWHLVFLTKLSLRCSQRQALVTPELNILSNAINQRYMLLLI